MILVDEKIILEHQTMKSILIWLTDNFQTKKTGEWFNYQDVQQYIRLGKLPKYLGNYRIRMEQFENHPMYTIYEPSNWRQI